MVPEINKPIKKKLSEDKDYLLSYSTHLEKRVRSLESERDILLGEKEILENEIRNLNVLNPAYFKLKEIIDILETLRSNIDQKQISMEEIYNEIIKIINLMEKKFL